MMKSNIQLFDQALSMRPMDKAALIEKLFQSFDTGQQKSIDTTWAVEAESRIDAYSEGEITARPFTEMLRELDNK